MNGMKKLILFLFILFSSFVFDNGTISNAENGTISNAENSKNADVIAINYDTSVLEKRIADMENEMYTKNLVQYIEFNAEIIFPENFDTKYIKYTYDSAEKMKISTRMVFRLIFKESSFDNTVVSPRGATGYMQLMPSTRKDYYKNLCIDTLKLDKNEQDIYIGMYYLNDMYTFWHKKGNSEKNSWKLGLASYNAGLGKVFKYLDPVNKGIPPYQETQNFVDFILKTHSNPKFFASFAKKYENAIKNHT